jgi:uncharacterized YigZ family protein
MVQPDFYTTIAHESVAEFKDRGSRFLAYAFPIQAIDEFKIRIKALKEEHPKAVHFCFAYRLGTDGNLFRAGDDGEPSGSAGRPILGQLDSKQVTNAAVVVVRYFGGTLLGVPGLINAYKSAASFALQTVPLLQKQIEDFYLLEFDYNRMNYIMQVLKQCQCTIYEQELQLFCRIKAGIPRNRKEEALMKLGDFHELQLQPLA